MKPPEKTIKLLREYSTLMKRLKVQGVIHSGNNPVADFAEYIACQMLHLTLAKKNSTGHDAVDAAGRRYEVKSRRLTEKNGSLQLGAIRQLQAKYFDFLVVVIFSEDFELVGVWKIPRKTVAKYARFSKYQNAYILTFSDNVKTDKTTVKIA